MNRYILLIILFQTVSFDISGNDNRSPVYIGLRSNYGFIIPHAEKIRSISDSNPRGLEFNFGWHHTGDDAWQYCFCYPRTGLMLSWISFDNPEILGNAFMATPYIEPFFSAGSALSASVKTGIGLAWLDNIYDPVTNPQNHFYSTSLSFHLFMNFGLNWRLNDRLTLILSGYYNHISNGGNSQPNRGINFPTASLGIDYYFPAPDFPVRSREDYRPEEKKASSVRLSAFYTWKEISKEDRRQYPVYGFSPKYSYLFGRLSAVSAGFEFVSDGSLRERIRMHELPGSDHRRFSVFAGHELLIGKFNFFQEAGVYLYAPYTPKDRVYQRYGLEYFIFEYLSAGLSFKAHRHVADFLDFRVTYGF
jgi:hypothetical protein